MMGARGRFLGLAAGVALIAITPASATGANSAPTFDAAVVECYTNPLGALVGATATGGAENSYVFVRIDYQGGFLMGAIATDEQGSATGIVASAAAYAFPITFTPFININSDGTGNVQLAPAVVVDFVCPDPTASGRVDDLRDAGVLERGEANSLLVKLGAAAAQADHGNVGAATNQYEAFIAHVNALVGSGRLSAGTALTLIQAARNDFAALGS